MAAMMDRPATADAERLSEAFVAYQHDLLRYVTRRTGAEEARDVVATVFAIAWRKIDHMPADALPWLYRIAGFEVLKVGRRRAQARRLAVELAAEPTQVRVDDQEVVVDALWVDEVIAALRPLDAELLRLVVWEDLDVPRAAAVLGCSVSAAHVRLHRLRKRVEDRLRVIATEDRRREGEAR